MPQPAYTPAPPGEDARERAVRLLTDAYAYDVIDDVEFERRLGILGLNPSSRAIDQVVADLPAPPQVARMMASGIRPSMRDVGRISGFMSETRRKGPWRVPPRLKISAFMCDMKLDLRYAAIPPGCVIEVGAFMANVTLTVAPGMTVEFNVHPFMASALSDADDGPSLSGAPHIEVCGSAMMSEVRVKVRGYR